MLSGYTTRRTFAAAFLSGMCLLLGRAEAQNYERYRPQTIPQVNPPRSVPREPLPPLEGSDRVLVESLDAVIILDHADKVDPDNANGDSVGIEYDFESSSSLVFSRGFRRIVESYLGEPITLRRLSEMSREMILYFRRNGQPVVDVQIPEQRITEGTVQVVVVESRVGKVIIKGGCHFDPYRLRRWICCTRPGMRIYEPAIANDLFWLNQSPFRRVDIDMRPGASEGTTDIVFETTDVLPLNSYLGYEDTGVRSLKLERIIGGLIWGNAFGRGGSLSYQYTADPDFRHLHAHAVSYLHPLNRCWSFQGYGSWAGVDPKLTLGLQQRSESWQAGMGIVRHLVKNQYQDLSLSMGFDFKTTNNNLEFGGAIVSTSNADLAQLRLGIQHIRRFRSNEYSILAFDVFVGPGEGFSPGATTAAFNTIRPGTSPDYVYGVGRFEGQWNLPWNLQLVGKARGQAASERLLFSETLGFGGFDSIRGYDQRAFFGDHGWITNLELGPQPWRWCGVGGANTLRVYGLVDAGGAYINGPLPGEVDEELVSFGVGLRWSISQRAQLRVDYAHGIENVPNAATRDRLHIGFTSLFGPRP